MALSISCVFMGFSGRDARVILKGISRRHNLAAEARCRRAASGEGAMNAMQVSRWVLLAVTACVLSACFDLDQDVSIHRDGSGTYRMAIAAEGAIGTALKDDRKNKDDMLKPNKAVVTTEVRGGKVIKTARVDFQKLSDIVLNDESVSLTVLDRGWFGITPSHMRFRRSYMVDAARAKQKAPVTGDDQIGRDMIKGIFGDHTYSFSVTLPGSIDRIAPVKIDGVEVKPDVSGDFYHGHTIVWRMPLTMLFETNRLNFEVDFSAVGSFNDVHTRKGQ
jgi:hypothetical protein